MPSFVILFAYSFHSARKSGPEVLHGSFKCRQLKLGYCGFTELAPNFSSLCNLESLTITDPFHDLTSLQDLDRLTQLTIRLPMELSCHASPDHRVAALICPRNLLQLESSNHSYSAHDGLAIDKVRCHLIARCVALTRPA